MEPYITTNSIQYVIALGGASGYRTRGIPHAWLVSPKGEIVWEGHPASLNDPLIEEQLKSVRLTPEFDLPRDLRRAQGYIEKGSYSSAIRALESYVKRPKDDDVAKVAQETIAKLNKWAEEKYNDALELGKDGYYADAMDSLELLEKGFKGLEIADKADDKLSEWKKDKDIKLELDGAKYLGKARELIGLKKYDQAGKILKGMIESSKFEGTKVREQAQKQLQGIRDYL